MVDEIPSIIEWDSILWTSAISLQGAILLV